MPLRHALADLERMAFRHVGYEVTRMAGYAVLNGGDAREAVLEAYLIHVRAVNEFLIKDPVSGFPRDVLAADYFDRPWACTTPPLDTRQVRDLHRRLAHLSLDRLDGNAPGGDFDWASGGTKQTPAWKMVRAFGRFLGDLETEHPERRQWFGDIHDIAKRLLNGTTTVIPRMSEPSSNPRSSPV